MIELLVALAILAIIAMFAAPNMSDMVRSNRVQSQARELAGALSMARSEAVSRGRFVAICRSANGTSCGGTWSDGWLVFVDGTTAGAVDAGDTVLRVYGGIGDNSLTVVNDATPPVAQNFVRFDRNGFSNQKLTFKICDAGGDVRHARAVLMENTGRVVFSRADSAGVHLDVRGVALTCQ